MMKIKILNKSNNPLPQYEVISSAGMDLKAFIDEDIILKPFERKLIPTGIHISLPIGYEAQIRPRSGLAYKQGITVLNSPGTIDPLFVGQIQIILINLSNNDFIIKSGDRVAQMVISKFETIEWEPVIELEDTERGEGGFGHTGV